MPQPEGKIYNDAPDEFAEFIDSGRAEVSLRDLGGMNNPFLKEGIYKGARRASVGSDAHAYCPKCGEAVCFAGLGEGNTLTCNNPRHGPCAFCVGEDDCTFFSIDHAALAEFMSRFSTDDLTKAIMKAFTVAKKMGYDVRPMRSMDAAEFADKVLHDNADDRSMASCGA